MKRIIKIILRVLTYILIAIGLIFAAILIWLMHTWVQLSYSELIYHLGTSIAGTNKSMAIEAVLKYALPAVLLIGIVIVANEIIYKKFKKYFVIILTLLAVIVLDFGIGLRFNHRTNIISDALSSILKTNNSDFIENNYIDAEKVQINFPDKKRNLIYIYLESMEMSCADEENGGAFDENVIPNLTKLSENNENFSGIDQVGMLDGAISLPGTDWTMGGIFAQSTGLPLKIALDGNAFGDGTTDRFYPGITAIGDILEENGYKNVFLLGSDAEFGGRRLFFETHGDYDIHDYNYAKEVGWIPQDYEVWWGYEDEKLFDFAMQDLTELANSDEPFNYTMLTVDTHFEDGYVCDLCSDDFGDNQYANVFACSDRQVVDFINWVQQQDFYENTTIVLCGDHITMDSDFYDAIDSDYQRKTYTCIINGACEKEKDTYREYATIDMFPTTLAALGADISSDRLGIGTNLYSDSETIVEQYGLDACSNELKKNSTFLENMSGLSLSESDLEEMLDKVYLEVANENGMVRFRVLKMDLYLNLDSINELELLVSNTKTGESAWYNFEIVNGLDPYTVAHTDIPYDELMSLDCKLFISIGDYENYLVQEFTPDMFEEWDIRWDQ